MFEPATAAAINRLLRDASWAREELKRHAGKTARFDVAPFAVALTVLENGDVAPAAAGSQPDVTAKLTPGIMLRFAAGDETAWKDVEVAGDTDFGASINHLSRNLRWDVEEDLSRFFGDVAAHRMAEAGRTARHWGEQAADNFGRSIAEYWTEEQPLIAGKREVDAFNRDVDRLRDDVARLEKRIENLLNRR